jgi:hypothetical protein
MNLQPDQEQADGEAQQNLLPGKDQDAAKMTADDHKHYHTTRPIGPMWHIPYASCVGQFKIQSLIFDLVNLESSHTLSQYLEPHKEFFI